LKGYFRAIGAGSWTLTKTFTAHGDGYANGGFAQVVQYHDNTNGRNVWIVGITHAKSDGTEDGWWLVTTDTGAWTRINSTVFAGIGITQYQARIVGVVLNTLWWTDPGAVATPPAANFLAIQSGHNDVRDIITNIIPYAPTSLLVSTTGSGWWVVDGDITDPVVRQMSSDHQADTNQKTVTTENGVVFFERERGVFVTQNMAANFTALDSHLTPWVGDTSQGFGYLNGFLFAPNGRVLDAETSAWFTLSDAATAYSAFEQALSAVNGVDITKGMYVPQWQSGGAILTYGLNERNSARAETYTFKTAPIRDDHSRLVYFREVQIGVDSFSAEATIVCTVNGTARTSAALGTGKNVVSFLFSEHAEYLDATFTVASNHSGVEAPVTEFFRLGTRADGHQIHY
jgi:hypothetical protein